MCDWMSINYRDYGPGRGLLATETRLRTVPGIFHR